MPALGPPRGGALSGPSLWPMEAASDRIGRDRAELDRSRALTVPELVARSARRAPDAPALACEADRRTFGELEERSNRLAGALAARGVGPGDHVAMLQYNGVEFVEAFLAIHKLGACAVPVNFRLSREEVDYVLEDCGARLAIADQELAERAGGVETLVVGPDYEAALAGAAPERPDHEVRGDDLAFLMYTSGTTGRPKGAMLSHQNLVVNTTNWLYEVGARPGDVWLSGLPLFHIGGLNGILPFLHLGALAVIEPSGGFDPGLSIARLAEHDVSMCFFVPTQWQEICSHPEVGTVDAERLRKAMWGASQAPLPTLELLAATFPSVEIVNAFGQTEMSSNTCFLRGEDAIRKMGSVGRPALGVEVRIVDEEGGDVTPGEVGEIVYRGPTVMQGYHGKPEATAEAFAGGWFHSGDLVREDADGLHLRGRPAEGHADLGRRERLPGRGRAGPDRPSRRRRGGGGRHPARALGGNAAGGGRRRPRRRGHRGGADRALPRTPRRLQEAFRGRLRRRAPPQRRRQGPEAPAPRHLRRLTVLMGRKLAYMATFRPINIGG